MHYYMFVISSIMKTHFSATKPTLLSSVQIRQIERSDLPALEWDGEYTHFRRLYKEIYEGADKGRAIMWVADLNGTTIIGQLFVQLSSARTELANGTSRAYIYSFRIQPPYRDKGLGTYMLQIAEKDLVERGFQWVTLNVARDNPDARRLYERLGYRVIAMEPGNWTYRDDHGITREVHEPAWRMEKRLIKPLRR